MGTQAEFTKQFEGRANEINTMEDFIKLFDEVRNYEHDYGSIVIGMKTVMMGAMRLLDRSPQGGITGFQASALGWEMVGELFLSTKGKPLKLVNYDDLLFPQYERKFDRVISQDTWEWVKKEAQKNLDQYRADCERGEGHAHPNVVTHWQSIIEGTIPFDFVLREE